MAIPALLQERGVDASRVLGRVGIDPHVFSDAASWLPFDVVGRIVAECATATACPHFGLLLGMRSGADSAVLAGDLARNADTVGSGLRLLLAHMHLHDRGGVAALTEISDDQVEFSYAIYHANTPGIAEMMDGIAASLYAFVQRLCGSRWAPTEVRLARRRFGQEVGIERAKGLITVLPTDAENLYVVLSAKGLNPNLFIVARAGEEGSEQKLLRAGADRVISPYHIGGLRIAHTVLKPAVVDFIELATKSGNMDLQPEEIQIPAVSDYSGLSLDQCGFGKELGVIIVAIKKPNGDMKFNPTYLTLIEPGDTLIALGEVSKLKVLEGMIAVKK